MGEYEGGFLPRGALEIVVSEHLQTRFPDAFRPEHLQVVGIDVPARKILDIHHQEVEPRNGQYELARGTYLMLFGFSLDELLGKLPGLKSRMFWRSSNHRVGAIGGGFVLLPEQHEDIHDERFMGGEVFGLYEVANPHGVVIDENAGLAQLAFSCGYVPRVVSEHLKPRGVEQFTGPGHIGRRKTIIAESAVVHSQQLPDGRIGWKLEQDTAYFVQLGGAVSIPIDEVYTPSLHRADDIRNPALWFMSTSTCLGDPGYRGNELGMTLLCTAKGITLGENDGLLRFRREQVLRIRDIPMAQYGGQWQRGHDSQVHQIEFRDLAGWGLTGGIEPSIDEIVARIREAGISV